MYRGKVIGEYSYDAWGNVTTIIHEDTNPNEVDRKIVEINPYRYKGYYMDIETGLYYCNARYYDPKIYQWIQRDNIEYLDNESLDGLNLYLYCNNDLVNLSDPEGHFAISAIIIGALIAFVTTGIKDYINDGKLFNGDISGLKYFGSILSGAIGGFGSGLATTILTSGLGNVIEAAFTGNISFVGDAMIQFALGGIIGGVGYGISKGITSIFADKKIFGILGNLSDNTKVNKRLANAGFSNLKIGKHGLNNVYEKMYKELGYDTMEKVLSYGYDAIVGLVF